MTAITARCRRARAAACLLAPTALALALLWGSPAVRAAGEATVSEYQVKAAFLKNFVKFVEWPSQTPGSLTLCILGEDPFKDALKGTADVGAGRSLTSRRIGGVGDAAGCQAVFVTAEQRKAIPEIVAALKGKPVLTIGDGEAMAAAGLMLSFLVEEQKVRFEANLAPARSAGLTISSRLLGLAKTVHNPR
jgi:hypothetical protein